MYWQPSKPDERSAIDHEAVARGRALRKMRGAVVSINGVAVGRVEEIQIEHRAGGGYDPWFFPRIATGQLKFSSDEAAIHAAMSKIREDIRSNYGFGGIIPLARRAPMAEAKQYEKKTITALVYRQFETIEEIREKQGAYLTVAQRNVDMQMIFIGYVYEGETPEQIINEDIEKMNPIKINEDRNYLVFSHPEVHVAEGPKSRVKKVRGMTSANTFAVDGVRT
jgi:hypothetical protein